MEDPEVTLAIIHTHNAPSKSAPGGETATASSFLCGRLFFSPYIDVIFALIVEFSQNDSCLEWHVFAVH